MTFKQLSNLMVKHNIPEDVQLLSDSGWECCETEMDGVFYSEEINVIVFTQERTDKEYIPKGWKSSSIPKDTKFVKLE